MRERPLPSVAPLAKLTRRYRFNLCLSPRLEATQMVEKLLSFEPPILKLATFSLRTLIKERVFLTEFLRHGGLDALQEVIKRTSGNTLAYSLLCMQSLMDLEDRGWEGLEDGFVSRIVEIIGQCSQGSSPFRSLIRLPINSHRTAHQHLSTRHGAPAPIVSRLPSHLIRRLHLDRLLPLTPPDAT